jgi:hypothetical protein
MFGYFFVLKMKSCFVIFFGAIVQMSEDCWLLMSHEEQGCSLEILD